MVVEADVKEASGCGLTHNTGQRACQRTDCDKDPDELAGVSAPNPIDNMSRRTEVLRSLLDTLPPAQAEALALRTMLGFSLAEIAEACGSPPQKTCWIGRRAGS